MANFTPNTYQMKREILTFSNKIFGCLSKPERKFTADMTYGMLASGSCLLTDVVDQLHEDSKKVNSVERLTRHLNKGIPGKALKSYLSTIRKWVPSEPVSQRYLRHTVVCKRRHQAPVQDQASCIPFTLP